MSDALMFTLGQQAFALSVDTVRHVLKYPDHITPIPHSTHHGLMNMRGRSSLF